MSDVFEVIAEKRSDIGKGASRRLRREADKLPAIIYGGGKDPISLTLQHKDVSKSLENEAFYSHILDINIEGKKEKAVLKAIQRHPSKAKILHMDFLRVTGKEAITMRVPIHFIGEDIAPGVKQGGGTVAHLMSDVEIRCLPSKLPEFLEVDLSNLELDQSLHLSDLKLPEGVEVPELTQEHDSPVASIYIPKAAPAEEEEAAAAEGEETEEGEAGAEESAQEKKKEE